MHNPSRQTSLFGDGWMYPLLLAQLGDHPLIRMKPILDQVIARVEPKLRTCYSTWNGRPACSIGTILKLHVLEYLYNLSDPAVTRMCVHDFLFRWFVDLDITDKIPDDTTLVRFRRRLKEDGFFDILTELTTEAEQQGYLKGQLRVFDATHVFSNTPQLHWRGLVRQGMNKVLKVIERTNQAVSKTLREKYRRILHYAKGKERATRKAVRQAVKDFAQEVSGLVDDPTRKLLKTIKRAARNNPDKLVSLTDQDARWGHKRKDKTFGGYKVHVVCAQNGFVTNLEVLSGNINEGDGVERLLAPEIKAGREIREVYADGLYDNVANRKYLRKERITDFIPPRVKKCQIQQFELEGTLEDERLKCPEGKYALGKIRQEQGDLYYFSVADCRQCPRRGHCVSPGEVRKKVFLSDCRRLRNKEWKEKYRQRTVVERDFSHAKLHRGLGRARYHGIGKMRIQALLTFITDDVLLMVRKPAQPAPGGP